jgi:hypothetical protein
MNHWIIFWSKISQSGEWSNLGWLSFTQKWLRNPGEKRSLVAVNIIELEDLPALPEANWPMFGGVRTQFLVHKDITSKYPPGIKHGSKSPS